MSLISILVPRLADILSTLLVPISPAADRVQHVAQYAPRYRLAFTLLNEDAAAGKAVVDWDISSAIRAFCACPPFVTGRIDPIISPQANYHPF
jgi:Phosphatidylinositol-glycan biosynthesis class S protein